MRPGIAVESQSSGCARGKNLLVVRRAAPEPARDLSGARRDPHGPAAPLREDAAGTGLSKPARAPAENNPPAERMGAKWLSDLLGLEVGTPEKASWADLSGA